jgi:hypothetical protein
MQGVSGRVLRIAALFLTTFETLDILRVITPLPPDISTRL